MIWLGKIVKVVVRGILKLIYEIEFKGMENIPANGPVIIAPNHVNYVDAPLLLAFIKRPVFFVAASGAFTIPVWSSLMKLFGTIPVERGKTGASTIKASMDVLGRGDALGIFPEGTFTADGHTVEAKMGTAHLALKSGAPIVPVTIAGAFHSWPRMGPQKRSLPRPWRLLVKFHEPIRLTPEEVEQHQRDKEFAAQLTQRIMNTLNRTLEPAIRADEKIDELIAKPAPRARFYELFPVILSLAAALLMGVKTQGFSNPVTARPALGFLAAFLLLGAAYFLYLVWDIRRPVQSVLTRAIRSYSPFVFILLYYPLLVRSIPFVTDISLGPTASYPQWLARMPAPANWIAVDWLYLSYYMLVPCLLVGLRYYYFHKFLVFQQYVRGLLLASYAGLLTVIFVPFFGEYYPIAVPADSFGLFATFMSDIRVSQAIIGSFPSVVITLLLYCMIFDYLKNRATFFAWLAFSASAVLSPVLLRGYPLGGVALNALTVAVIFIYMKWVPITAHDGRAI